MKVIYPDNVSNITATTENVSFPATNLMTEYVGEKWKATGQSATLSIRCSGGEVVALFGTNAITASVTVIQGAETISWETGVEWESDIAWVEGNESPTAVYDLSGSSVGALWAEYTERIGGHIIEILLTADDGEIVEAGVVVAGAMVSIRDPAYGIQSGFEDYSTIRQLNSGARYIDKESIAKTFSFQIMVERDTEFYEFMNDTYIPLGPTPTAFRIVDNEYDDAFEWVIYGSMLTPPSGRHTYPDWSTIQIAITEMI